MRNRGIESVWAAQGKIQGLRNRSVESVWAAQGKIQGLRNRGSNTGEWIGSLHRLWFLPIRAVVVLLSAIGAVSGKVSRLRHTSLWTVCYWLGFYGLVCRETLFPRYGRHRRRSGQFHLFRNGDSRMPGEEPRFTFGKNWMDFIKKNFDEARVEISQHHLLDFLGTKDLRGKYFLDIGCGSGLHSLAALRAGAARIVSFDYDQDSVRTTNMLKVLADSPATWAVTQGSALDKDFMATLDKGDIVYSWGVLHHTGALWTALQNAASLMKDDGCLYIALYDPTHMQPSAEFWVEIKKKYNRRSWIGKKYMEWWYVWRFIMQKNPRNLGLYLKFKRNYLRSAGRGMSMHTDIRDWLGGWPFEYATPAEVDEFCCERLGLKQVRLATGQACAEYLYVKAPEGYKRSETKFRQVALVPPFTLVKGNCYSVELPEFESRADTNLTPSRSDLVLLEDSKVIGFPHTLHENICVTGRGRFSHWARHFYFSTSDNSNPNSNGRSYELRVPIEE